MVTQHELRHSQTLFWKFYHHHRRGFPTAVDKNLRKSSQEREGVPAGPTYEVSMGSMTMPLFSHLGVRLNVEKAT